LIVGVGWAAQAILDAIQQHAPNDYEIVGFVDEAAPLRLDDVVVETEVIGYGADLARIAQELQVSEVILATTGNVDGELFQAIMDCYELSIPITPMPRLYEQLTRMVPVMDVRGHWSVVLPLEGRSPFDPFPILKRLLDVTLSLVGLLLFAAILPLLALLIVLDSPGPVFFAQERVGRAGHRFRLTKLRTMIPQAEQYTGPLWAVQGDPRVTRVGRFLRRSRLDEVPQLLQVLVGQMSLIGPRPERPAFVADLQERIPFYRARLSVRPGITGWAQVNYGYGSTVDDQVMKLQYDLYYIRHRSLLLDGLILLKTIGQVLALRGT
jgi:exopolysaccharide biosynthesis polyprenyl glycosylphosphotransferase